MLAIASISRALGASLMIGQLACGAPAPLQHVADKLDEKLTHAVDYVDDWVNAEPMEQRERKCAEEGGAWVKHVVISPCENGRVTLTVDGHAEQQECSAGEGGTADFQCVHRNEDGLSYFNDGPSVPNLLQRLSSSISGDIDQLRYLDLFWSAGVNHDYCYHNGALVYGLSQLDCDAQYYSDLSAVCANDAYRNEFDWFKQRSCRQVAATHYVAVRSSGASSFNVLRSRVVYPAWVPMWQQLNLPEDVVDEELADEIDSKLRWLGVAPAEDEAAGGQ